MHKQDIQSLLLIASWLWELVWSWNKNYEDLRDDENKLYDACIKIHNDFIASSYDYITEYLHNEIL